MLSTILFSPDRVAIRESRPISNSLLTVKISLYKNCKIITTKHCDTKKLQLAKN